MNERIRELAEQAEKYADANFKGEPFWTEAYESKFAQLIVEQCAGIIESQDVDPSFKLRMSWAVKQYFGVENGTI
jgi:hypothetical protein